MASLQKYENGIYHASFRFRGRRFKRSLQTKDARAAKTALSRIEERLWLIGSGHLEVPDEADLAEFLFTGKSTKTQKIGCTKKLSGSFGKRVSLHIVFESFVETIENGNLEKSTVDLIKIHQRHIERVFGGNTPLQQITAAKLQEYINERSKALGKYGRRVSGSTIKKELVTFRSIRNWAKEMGHVEQDLSIKNLRFPKSFEQLPFQTRKQIEEQIRQGQTGRIEQAELWESLFLLQDELDEVLKTIESSCVEAFVFPMIATACFTGARRSELLRMRVHDYSDGHLAIRERKRIRGQHSFRHAPAPSRLQIALDNWIPMNPGGKFMFCSHRSPQLSPKAAHHHLNRALAGTNWECIRGFHVFRHSFISAMAMAGIDQRIIDEIVGHTTDQQRQRYRHLTPEVSFKAVEKVFG